MSKYYLRFAGLAVAAAVVMEITMPAHAGSFLTNEPMNAPRRGQTATMLPNGKLLIAGGHDDDSQILASAELYDPATHAWTNTGTMNVARYGHTATLLPNGKVLAAGGVGTDQLFELASVELYDPNTGVWTATNSMSSGHWGHTATLLTNGLVLVTGGAGPGENGLTNADLYDPTTGAWRPTSALSPPRFGHTATLLANGQVLVAGGIFSESADPFANVELYDPATETWTETNAMSEGRLYHTATLLPGGQVLIAGGFNWTNLNLASAEVFNSGSGTWASISPMSVPRQLATSTLLTNGQVLVVAGFNNTSPYGGILSAETYDPSSGTWLTSIPMIAPRLNNTATLLSSGQVLVTGGYAYGAVAEASTELYDPRNDHFALNSSMLPDGTFHITFTNTPGASFSVLTSTNCSVPLENWIATGPVSEGPAGQYQFTTPNQPSAGQRFYTVRSP